MLETHTSDRRLFWTVVSTLSAIAAVVAWNVL
jgi:hypothetical protein